MRGESGDAESGEDARVGYWR